MAEERPEIIIPLFSGHHIVVREDCTMLRHGASVVQHLTDEEAMFLMRLAVKARGYVMEEKEGGESDITKEAKHTNNNN